MPRQQELRDQTNPILPLTPGFAEPSTYVHQWVFPHRDTPSSDPQEETHPEEEEEADSLGEATQEEEAVDSQEEEDLCKVILKEDHKETD